MHQLSCWPIALVALMTSPAVAQEHEHGHSESDPAQRPAPNDPEHADDSSGANHDGHAARGHGADGDGGLGLPVTREASGTAWQPDTTPMYGKHFALGDGSLMLHGNAFGGYNHQGSDRGARHFTAPNWVMLMPRHPLGGGEIAARGMFSFEPVTMSGSGYPLLLQTGETFRGEPLHDRQHPHDLFMEVALSYTRAIADRMGVQVYAAPAGEPALGPVAFPHRASAMSDPLAPLSHHWQDSTHISFGVLTLGAFTRHIKLEGSWFNGREPDEERFDLDLRAPDSWAGRLSANLAPPLSVQVSYGYLDSPEALEPELSLHRATSSVMYTARSGTAGAWSSTAAWGRNIPSEGPATDSWLIESNLDFDGSNIVFGRAEYVAKTGHDMVLTPALEDETFGIASFVLGYVHGIRLSGGFLGLGARVSVNVIPEDLESFYGTRTPVGAMVYLQLRFGMMASH